jgi:hypothetical protein
MAQQSHILRSLYFEVETPDFELGLDLKESIPLWWNQKGKALLGEKFDQLVPEDRLFSIDYLVLDLGSVSARTWEAELEAQLTARLDEWHGSGELLKEAPPLRLGLEKGWKTWIHFLKNGTLPWWSEKTVLVKEKLPVPKNLPSREEIRELISILQDQPQSRLRLIHNLPETTLGQLIFAIWKQQGENWKIPWLQKISTGTPSQKRTKALFWLPLFEEIGGARPVFTRLIADFFIETNSFQNWSVQGVEGPPKQEFEKITLKVSLPPEVLKHVLKLILQEHTLSVSAQFFFQQWFDHLRNTSPRPESSNHLSENRPEAKEISVDKNVPEDELDPVALWQDEKDRDAPKIKGQSTFSPGESGVGLLGSDEGNDFLLSQTEGMGKDDFVEPKNIGFQTPHRGSALGKEPLFVSYAGLVLVHPFLPQIFDTLDIWREGAFCNDSSQEKGVHLLSYLACGKEKMPEYEMILPKILAGWDLERAVAPQWSLTDMEKKECHELLLSLIEHWGMLKGGDEEALQEEFFAREGKLSPVGDDWRLQIEQKTLDILLSRLPWSLGFIHLPWNDWNIMVEWT